MQNRQTSVAAVLDDADLLFVDVGARGDIPDEWMILDGTARVLSFEPDPVAAEALRNAYDRRGKGHLYRVVTKALSENGGPRTLYRTNKASGSSLLPLDTPRIQEYVEERYLHPIEERPIDTERLEHNFRNG